MATNGSTSVAVTSYDTLKFVWTQVSQSITNNTTTISWSLQLVSGSAGKIVSSASKSWSVTVSGATTSNTNSVAIDNNATKILASGQSTIAHNADGTKVFSYSFSQAFGITFAGVSIGTIEEGEEYCLYSWLVRDATTVAKGLVEFSLHFECDDPETGKLIYRWGTYTCTDCEILDSVNTVMGAFAAIYINGETLVFADYTPVRNESLDLTSCVVPEGVVEITELGTHDVGRYAYAEVKAVYEQPKIEVSDATIKATANGLTTTTPLDIPGRAKKVTVTFTGTVPAYIDYQELQEDGSLADAKLITYMEENPPTSMTVVAGSFMKFSNILGGKVTVDCPLYPSAIRGTVDSGTSQTTLFWVPSYAESVNIIFK